MQKQNNRGQDGVGVANIKLDMPPGKRYISRYRTTEPDPVSVIFEKVSKKLEEAKENNSEDYLDDDWMKNNIAFTGELWLGHLRYGTHGKNSIENCHPMIRQNNWRSKNLVVAGNFNMTNVEELFNKLVELGQHPKEKIDTITVMEKIGHFLDDENQLIFDKYKDTHSNDEITQLIEKEIDLQRVLQRACKDFDGGYAMAGLTGFGSAFVARDPAGIRPAFYYADEEIIVVASEKPAIKTALGIDYSEIKEIKPAHALIIEKSGDYREVPFISPVTRKSCSFERIYFSKGNDPAIHRERKTLGKLLIPQILEKINNDLENTVFSYIPNTAEISFYGMVESLNSYLIEYRKNAFLNGELTDPKESQRLLSLQARVEKLVIKDAKLRTFITDDEHRNDMVAHVYDTTYEVINKNQDTLVVIDDSIVRGTTLEKSIIKMLDLLEPKKIVIVSSAPQIRYPDCYGIDMSKMKDFIAFRAVLALLKETNQEGLLKEVYDKCEEAVKNNENVNYVKELYKPFSYEQISNKIAEIVTPEGTKAKVEIIYQTVENLHEACPNDSGDWYFTGNFPTPGGNRVVNQAYINFFDGNDEKRAY